jgi:hypothetical protein
MQALLQSSDLLVVQREHSTSAGLKAIPARAQVVSIPCVVFPGFHPDIVYAVHEGQSVPSPIGGYHSSLVLYGWKKGLTPKKVQGLFCKETYRHLGFFSYIDASTAALRREGQLCEMPLDKLLDRWMKGGCFMHSINHPKIHVLADMAEAALAKAGLQPVRMAAEFVHDNLLNSAVWPVYPEFADVFGWTGSYYFKQANSPTAAREVRLLDLDEYIERSFEIYGRYDRDRLTAPRLSSQPYLDLERALLTKTVPNGNRTKNPYATLPDYCFWRRSIERMNASDVDPVVGGRFRISKSSKVATAGSCFAQHIARELKHSGYNYFVSEAAPPGLTEEAAKGRNYAVFSARFGNIYTTRQLVQLLARAYGRFRPKDSAWKRNDGAYVDPFRPQIEPEGYPTASAVAIARENHLAAVRTMFEEMNVFVFTLGLTEGWRSREDGAVFPLAPGVVAGAMDGSRYEFVNFTVDEVRADLDDLVETLRQLNPAARIVLTVSPVPLVATYENRHVLVSTTHSKAVLRVAADYAAGRYANVEYFPSFEIIAGNFNRGAYYEEDLRSIRPDGVAHVMRLFMRHYSEGAQGANVSPKPAGLTESVTREVEQVMQIVCDEEQLDS